MKKDPTRHPVKVTRCARCLSYLRTWHGLCRFCIDTLFRDVGAR